MTLKKIFIVSLFVILSCFSRSAWATEAFEDFLSKNNAVMLVIDPENGQIIDANPAAVQFYGYAYPVLTTMAIQQINQLSAEQVAEERALAAREKRNYFIFRHEIADGTIKTVEVASYPVEVQGHVRLVSVITDITAQREIQDTLWHYQNRLEEMVDQQTSLVQQQNRIIIFVLATAVIITLILGYFLFLSLRRQKKINADLLRERQGLDDIIWGTQAGTWEWWVQSGEVRFNETWANMIGYQLEELEPLSVETWKTLVHDSDLHVAFQSLQKCFEKTIDHYAIEFRMKHKKGHWVWILAKGKVVQWQDGHIPVRMAGTHQDISDQKELEKKLIAARSDAIAANNAKSDFLANMSHELRTPMVGIRGTLELMRENQTILDLASEHMRNLDLSSQSLLTLLDDILDLSKIEAGLIKLDMTVDQPAAILENIAHIFSCRLEGENVKMTSNAHEYDDYYCVIESLRFRQIVTNLVSNAVKFTHEGTIDIALEVKPSSLHDLLTVTVRDTGIGMDAQEVTKVFNRFEQAETGTTRKYGGTGLGLTISSELAAMMGGEVTARSSKGEGSSFQLILPVERAHKIKTQKQTVQLGQLNILLAEDNLINQRVIGALLKKKDHTVDIVSNGREAVQRALDHKFDLILMDINMPEMDGMDATREIRLLKNQNAETPIIALTADAIADHRADFMQAGVNEVVTKPVDIERLQVKMSELIT